MSMREIECSECGRPFEYERGEGFGYCPFCEFDQVEVPDVKKFKITIEEMVIQDFEIYAESMEEAMEIAEEKYNEGTIVLEPGNLVAKQMCGTDPDTGDCTEWTEF